METLMTLTFFAPMAALVAMNLLTHRTDGPAVAQRRAVVVPLPPARTVSRVANAPRYLEAA